MGLTGINRRVFCISIFSPGDDKPEKTPEPVSTVTADEVPDVPNNSFLLRRSRTPSPVREKRLQQAKNRFVIIEGLGMTLC